MIRKKMRRLLALTVLLGTVFSCVFYAQADTISDLKKKQQ